MADINVLMMGGRRAGKTSILAAMDDCANNKLSEVESLSVVCTGGGISLSDKLIELESYFTDSIFTDGLTFVPDQTPSDNPKSYEYEVTVGERETGYTLKFTDVPGEHYEKQEYFQEVQERINKSHVILIAVDTPHLMEDIEDATGVGSAHVPFNRVHEITHFFKSAFQGNKDPRMVIFVPLKCEKYYHKKKLGKVCERIKVGYKNLLDFLDSPQIRELCTVAVMPICTLGGAEFFDFDGDKRNVGIYNYVRNVEDRKYQPRYCENLLFIILHYLIAVAEKNQMQQFTLLRLFNQFFRNRAKMEDLTACKDTICKLIYDDAPEGFEIIQDPMGMKG